MNEPASDDRDGRDPRLTELEIALTHQEAALDELGGVVRTQADRIDRLERLVALLAQRGGEADEGPPPAADAPPPHW